ncbi:MAG: EAL domain-containing protein [Spirochaetaceae bacterium]|nr:MAG: EAL domain-containing protein [Spirochaetaceae bacterium]
MRAITSPVTTDDHTLLWQQYSLDSVLQPIINLKDHEIIGVEALVRGVDGRGAICTPHTLFETASQTGGILVLDRQCREAAFRSYQRIHGDDRRYSS